MQPNNNPWIYNMHIFKQDDSEGGSCHVVRREVGQLGKRMKLVEYIQRPLILNCKKYITADYGWAAAAGIIIKFTG